MKHFGPNRMMPITDYAIAPSTGLKRSVPRMRFRYAAERSPLPDFLNRCLGLEMFECSRLRIPTLCLTCQYVRVLRPVI